MVALQTQKTVGGTIEEDLHDDERLNSLAIQVYLCYGVP